MVTNDQLLSGARLSNCYSWLFLTSFNGRTNWQYHLVLPLIYITECIASQYIIQSKEKDQLTLIPQFPNNIKPTNNSHRALINPYTKKPIPQSLPQVHCTVRFLHHESPRCVLQLPNPAPFLRWPLIYSYQLCKTSQIFFAVPMLEFQHQYIIITFFNNNWIYKWSIKRTILCYKELQGFLYFFYRFPNFIRNKFLLSSSTEFS